GLNGYLEMQRLVGAGMSLRQLFEAATLSNAKAFGLDGNIGTVQPGKRANLVLLGRSPLESVEAITFPKGWDTDGRLEVMADVAEGILSARWASRVAESGRTVEVAVSAD